MKRNSMYINPLVSHLKNSPNLHVIQPVELTGFEHLQELFEKVLAEDGEGLVLRHPDSSYLKGRSGQMFKKKNFKDCEAIVCDYKEGKGSLNGLMGAVECELYATCFFSFLFSDRMVFIFH